MRNDTDGHISNPMEHDGRSPSATALEKGGKTIAVVVPCYNEAEKIRATLTSIPDSVDRIYVVDDHSADRSVETILEVASGDGRIQLIRHDQNRGVGAAISTGYLRCIEDRVDVAVVMAGDGQMDPSDLPDIVGPVLAGDADYVKGNRFFHRTGTSEIPRHRLYGNLVLSILTKIVSGYWHVSDTQCGYTAINRDALEAIDWTGIYPRYGCPNDILTKLNVANMRVAEVAVHARYGKDWSSDMKVARVILPILRLLWSLFLHRLYYKYIYLNGHPIIIFYAFSGLFAAMSLLLMIYIIVKFALTGVVPQAALIMFGIALGSMIQLLLGAFSLDHQANEDLAINLRVRVQRG